MPNGKFFITKESDEILTKLMVTIEVDRPLALKIALSKGILDSKIYDGKSVKGERGREIPDRVVWAGFEYTLFTHLIIEKENKVIEDHKELDERFRFYIETGLEKINQELNQLQVSENYLIKLFNEIYGNDSKNREIGKDDFNEIAYILGL